MSMNIVISHMKLIYTTPKITKQINMKKLRYPQINQDQVLLFMVNKDDWPTRRRHLDHMVKINVSWLSQSRPPYNLCIVLIISKYTCHFYSLLHHH